MSSVKEAVKTLTTDEQDKVKQYITSIKEIKKALYELLSKGKRNLQELESGGNMSSGLTLHDEE